MMVVVVVVITNILQVPVFECYAKYFMNIISLYSHRTSTNGKPNAYSYIGEKGFITRLSLIPKPDFFFTSSPDLLKCQNKSMYIKIL